MLRITHHAQARLQQRGIPAHALENLLEFGRYAYDHRGATILFFDHKARNQLRRLIAGDDYKQIESYLDTYAILSGDGVVVTVGQPLWRNSTGRMSSNHPASLQTFR